MPKVPESRWRELNDPESEFYAPPKSEIEDEENIAKNLSNDFYDIEDRLNQPTQDYYTGQKDKYRADDPELFWEQLESLQTNYLNKIKNPELKKTLKERMLKIEQKIYRQFIPFVDVKINTFGRQNSPLEKNYLQHQLNPNELMTDFNRARSVLEHFKISKEEQIDFLNELDRLAEKLNRYQNEPTLFTFEKIEEELQKEVTQNQYINSRQKLKKNQKYLYDEATQKKNELKFNLWLAKCHQMAEIADRMLNKKIKEDCQIRAKSLLNYTERLKNEDGQIDDDFDTNDNNIDWAWKLLGIERDSSIEEIRQAYHNAALKNHPDINKDKNAMEKMKKINEAYELIKKMEKQKII